MVNASKPGFEVLGPHISSLTHVAIALPGTCADVAGHLAAGMPLTDPSSLVTFPNTLVLDAAVTEVALCVSTDSGITFTDQVIGGSIPVANDPNALVIETVDPLVTVAGATTVTIGTPSPVDPNAKIAFTSSSCLSDRIGSVALGGPGVVTLSAGFPSGGVFTPCYSTDPASPAPPASWIGQIAVPAQIFVLPAASAAVVGSVAPAAVGVGAPASVVLTRSGSVVAIGCGTCRIGFTLTTCSSEPPVTVAMPAALEQQTIVLPAGLPSAGAYKVCFSTNSGTSWTQQTAVTLTAVAANANAITAVSPAIFAATMTPTLTVSTPFLSPHTFLGVTADPDCSTAGNVVSVSAFSTASSKLTIAPALGIDGTYQVCYSVDGGVSYTTSGETVEVISALSSSITSFTPTVIGSRTTPAINFVNAIVSPKSAIAFIPAAVKDEAGACNQASYRTAVTALSAATNVALGSAFDEVSPTTYALCYTVTLGVASENWVLQTNPSLLTVTVATPTSLTSISPRIVAADALEVLTIGGLVATPTTKFAFSYTTSCATTLDGTTSYPTPSGTVVLASGLTQSGKTARLCYSVDDGVSWQAQGDDLSVAVVRAVPTSLTSMSPLRTGAGTMPAFSFAGTVPLSANVKVGFGIGSCSGTIFGQIDMTTWSSPASAMTWGVPPTPGSSTTYIVCFTVDSTTWVEQTSVGTLQVEVAAANSFSSLVPPNLGVGAVGFTLTHAGGSLPTPTSYLGITTGSCAAAGSFDVLLPFSLAAGGAAVSDTVLNMTRGISAPGAYKLCYSVTGPSSGFVEQTLVSLTGVAAAASDVTDILPKLWLSHVLEPLTLTLDAGFVSTPTTWLGFSHNSSLCEARSGRDGLTGLTHLAGASETLEAGVTDIGTHYVCISVDDGQSWITTAAGTVFVDGASPTSITGLSVGDVDANVISDVRFFGARLSPLTHVSLVNLGFGAEAADAAQMACDDASKRLEDRVLSIVPGANITLIDDGRHSVCYSENGGLSYVAQTSPAATLVVQECSQYSSCGSCRTTPSCAWCLSTSTCVSEAEACPVQAICPTCTPAEFGACPTLSEDPSVPARGVYTGGSVVPFVTTLALDPIDEKLECEFFNPATLRKTRVNATIVSSTKVECVAPPSELKLTAAEVRLYAGAELYTATDAVVNFEYYICEDVAVCDGCYTAERPECGYCMETQTCSASNLCPAPLDWGGSECPTISAVAPTDGLVTGGATITLTGTHFVDVKGMEVVFGSVSVNASFVSTTEYTVVTPRISSSGPVELSLRRRGLEYVPAAGVIFNFLGDPALFPKSPTSNAPMIIGSAVGAVAVVLCILAAILGLVYKRRKDREALLRPPVLTPEIRERIMFGAPPTLSADDRKMAGMLQSFVETVVMDHELIATIGDVTQATEMDKITKAVNMVYESRGLSLSMLLYMVSREVSLALSQSTLFRTNSFATKLFKTFSKMKGLDYLHESIGRQVNLLLLEGVGDVDAIKTKSSGNNALERFALLERCQRVFAAIQATQDAVPIEFRHLFQHVRLRMQSKFPVSSEDLGLYIADSLRDHLDDTSEAYIEGNNCFSDLAALAPHIQSDMSVLGSILGPVQENLANFESTITSLTSQLRKVNHVVDQLRGALDPNSEEAKRFLEEHQRVQNSIAVGGFMFLRFLVPALTAPEAFNMVHELPTPEERKLLVMIGKVLQNLSNGKEFGTKEKHMVQMNDFILENQTAVARLFDTLSTVPASSTPIAQLDRAPVPRRHLESAVVTLFKHARTNRDKIVARLHDHSFGGKQLPAAIMSQRIQAAKVFELVLDQTEQYLNAGAGSTSTDYLNTTEAGPSAAEPKLQSMIKLTDEVFDELIQQDDYTAPETDPLGDLGADNDNGGGVALATLTLTPIVRDDSSSSSNDGSVSPADVSLAPPPPSDSAALLTPAGVKEPPPMISDAVEL
ncbi:uncharacterized protein AMSG_07818 [Thecamonas trahens ATCC 50062]|uniref:Ras-GAP domain-containing protein n=1 Tax=Thecamonas trahens ATCC 50062 TaxID=461836 RepID=A0A0L0DHB1_THETB|nr:hypothetical protein AMSG_07818 [Thecamonas trahens ATCC 50062]KNC51749.1 hypothetical protein AMSG_07818 [Thecamonas trahens ATCC 50062]|eukprot:XP_013755877.1 hypothetical protein AMSG_07818 [Thecamonas trahens ATCC 50062]